MIQLRIGGQLLDLYPDENINLTRTVQNVSDISKTFTDFTESFSVPFTQNNNRIFRHWYNADITGGFDSRIRHNATIEINYAPFVNGVIQLNNVVIQNGSVTDYNITFFGSGVQLNETLGDDLLTDLDLSAFEFDWIEALVANGIHTGLFGNNQVIVPLISNTRNWTYGAQGGIVFSTNIAYQSAPPNQFGLLLPELRPSIKMQNIITAIQNKYNITFTSSFLNSDEFQQLYMYANSDKGELRSYSDLEEVILFDEDSDIWNKQIQVTAPQGTIGVFRVVVSVALLFDAGFDSVNGLLELSDGMEMTRESGTNVITLKYELNYNGAPETKNLSIKIASDQHSIVDVIVNERIYASNPNPIETLNVYYRHNVTLDSKIRFTDNNGFKGLLPKMKVVDFITSLINMFNLTVVSSDSVNYEIETLDNWYNLGSNVDLTKYIDTQNVRIRSGLSYNEINYTYDSTNEAVTNSGYISVNGSIYGNLSNKFGFNGGILDIESDFDNVLLSRLTNRNLNTLSQLLVGTYLDEDLEEIKTKPIIHYFSGRKDLDSTEYIAIRSQTNTQITRYNFVSQERINLSNNQVLDSLNFGSEISSFTLAQTNESLFSNYWSDYIVGVLSRKARIYQYNAVIPFHIITQIKLNDTIVIRGTLYRINEFKPNLTTGECKLELINVL